MTECLNSSSRPGLRFRLNPEHLYKKREIWSKTGAIMQCLSTMLRSRFTNHSLRTRFKLISHIDELLIFYSVNVLFARKRS